MAAVAAAVVSVLMALLYRRCIFRLPFNSLPAQNAAELSMYYYANAQSGTLRTDCMRLIRPSQQQQLYTHFGHLFLHCAVSSAMALLDAPQMAPSRLLNSFRKKIVDCVIFRGPFFLSHNTTVSPSTLQQRP